MDQGLTSDILHLSVINPYISSILRESSHAAAGLLAHLPRQISGAAVAAETATTGISGFAFQGTNAHVILGRWGVQGRSSALSCLDTIAIIEC